MGRKPKSKSMSRLSLEIDHDNPDEIDKFNALRLFQSTQEKTPIVHHQMMLMINTKTRMKQKWKHKTHNQS